MQTPSLAPKFSNSEFAGSGTPAFALAPEPLPAVWPKWVRLASLSPASI
jgi:hypothetical protein